MATYKVKLSKRAALLELNNRACNIYIDKASSNFVTKPGIINDQVRIPKEQIIIPVTDITKIEMPVSRFTPDQMCWMEIAWDD